MNDILKHLAPKTDTCIAFASGEGLSALSVLRISGAEAAELADQLFFFGDFRKSINFNATSNDLVLTVSKKNKKRRVTDMKGFTAAYGYLLDPDTNVLLDEVILTRYRAPYSYTGEEMVEITCHGGFQVRSRVFQAFLKIGAVPAKEGEFSKRAFLNGKMDLSQAEAIMDLIHAESSLAANAALSQLGGALSQKLTELLDALQYLLGAVDLDIEFPEYEDSNLGDDKLFELWLEAVASLKKLMNSYDQGRLQKEGLHLALLGAPNAGKSSLLNALLEKERAIVTDIAGTTRDTIDSEFNINGLLVRVTDTAGLRKTEETVERLGILRSLEKAKESDLVAYLMPLDSLDMPLLESFSVNSENKNFQRLKDFSAFKSFFDFLEDTLGDLDVLETNDDLELLSRKIIIIFSKSDLISEDLQTRYYQFLSSLMKPFQILFLSSKTNEGLFELKQMLFSYYEEQGISSKEQTVFITSQRHYEALERAYQLLNLSEATFVSLPRDIQSSILASAMEIIASIDGREARESLMDSIFKNFCVGK